MHRPTLPEGGWQTFGGTSAATPLYAGGVLLADGDEEAHGAPALGFLTRGLRSRPRKQSRQGPEERPLRRHRGNNDLGGMTAAEVGGDEPLGCCSANPSYDSPAAGARCG